MVSYHHSRKRQADIAEMAEGGVCGVCLSDITAKESHELECGHHFHTHCLIEWFRQERSHGRCPICRAAPGRAEESPAPDLDGVLLEEVLFSSELSSSEAHRILAPAIYGPRRNDPLLRPMVDRYMACRRRVAQCLNTRGAVRSHRAQDASRAAQELLACMALRDLPLLPLVVRVV